MIEIELSADLRPLLNRLQNIERQIPFVVASSLTKTAVKVKPEIRKEMTQVFDRPTRYTLNSIFVKPAKKQDENPTARVWLKDDSVAYNRGGNAATYLWPQIAGGSRPLKRFEIRLRNAGILPDGMFVVPGAGCKMDAHGNMNTGQLTAVLSKLGTIREAQDYGGRRRNTRYAGAQYFVVKRRVYVRNGLPISQHLPLGIWQRFPDRTVLPVYLFVNRANYRRIFEFDRVAKETALRQLPINFMAGIDAALRANP